MFFSTIRFWFHSQNQIEIQNFNSILIKTDDKIVIMIIWSYNLVIISYKTSIIRSVYGQNQYKIVKMIVNNTILFIIQNIINRIIFNSLSFFIKMLFNLEKHFKLITNVIKNHYIWYLYLFNEFFFLTNFDWIFRLSLLYVMKWYWCIICHLILYS